MLFKLLLISLLSIIYKSPLNCCVLVHSSNFIRLLLATGFDLTYILVLIHLNTIYRNIWLGNTFYNFCYAANMLNIRSRRFYGGQFSIARCMVEYFN